MGQEGECKREWRGEGKGLPGGCACCNATSGCGATVQPLAHSPCTILQGALPLCTYTHTVHAAERFTRAQNLNCSLHIYTHPPAEGVYI